MRAYAAALLLLLAGDAAAATCNLDVVGLDFGAVPQLNPQPVDTQATVTVTCSAEPADLQGALATVSYAIDLSPGQSGNALQRAMAAPSATTLPYGVYVDPAHATVWGDGTNGTARPGGEFTFTIVDANAGLTRSASHMAYGRVPAGTTAVMDTYSDTLVVSVSF